MSSILRINPRCVLLAISLLVIFQLFAFAKNGGLEVRSEAATLAETEPGKIVTTSFLVANHTDREEAFVEQLTLPEGWQKVAPADLPFSIASGAQAVRIVAVAIPASASAGRFEIKYAVRGQRDYGLADAVDFSAVVLPVSKLGLSIEQKPEMVIAGDEYIVRARLTNQGNARLSIRTDVKSAPSYPVKIADADVTLEPSAARDISLRIATDKNLATKTTRSLTIQSTAITSDGRVVSAKQTILVEVVPKVTGDKDPYWRMPAMFRFLTTSETGHHDTVQAELSGGGAIDESGTRKIDFLFRGPDAQQSGTSLALRDEYRLGYHDEDLDLHLGDGIYSLSPLTERYGYGRGAEVDYHPGAFGAGAYYMESRWRSSNISELGSQAKYSFAEPFEMKLNFLRKWDADNPLAPDAFPQNMLTLESHYKPGKWLDLDMEDGFSRSDNDGELNPAWRVDARGELPHDIYYSLQKTHAAPDFFGSYNNSDSTYATLTFPIYKKLRGNFSYNDYAADQALNPIESTVLLQERAWHTGVRETISRNTNVSLEYQDIERRDLLPPAAFDFTEQSLRLGLGQSFGKLSLQSYVDAGLISNVLTDVHDEPFQRYNLTLNYTPIPNQTYSLFGSHGPSSYTGDTNQEWSAGASATWRIRDSLALNLQYARNGYDSLTGKDQDSAQSSLTYTFANHQSLSVSARWTHTNSHTNCQRQNDAAFFVSYSVPLSLPFGKKTSTGTIKGHIFDVSHPYYSVPVRRAVIFADDAVAVSDENGDFIFPSLKPGIYTLRLDQSSIGTQRIALENFPRTIEVKRGTTMPLDVPVATACAISVKVLLFAAPATNRLTDVQQTANQTLQNMGGVAAVPVEISNGRQVTRQETDRNGNIYFGSLPPGHWTLKVDGENLPPHSTLDKPQMQLVLVPAQTQEVTVTVLSRPRAVTIIDGGTIQ